MVMRGVSFALEETEAVVLTMEGVPTVPPIQVGQTIVLSKPTVKYLDIMIIRR